MYEELMARIKIQLENEEDIIAKGGDKFLQLEARLKDPETGTLGEDIVIYAMRTIKDYDAANSFYNGYINHVKNNLEKYPKEAKNNPKDYVKGDMFYTLGYFTKEETFEIWNKVLKN